MRSNALRFRTRPLPLGPEAKLLSAALKAGLPINAGAAMILREPSLPTGVPDLVAVERRPSSIERPKTRCKLCLVHLQMLHFLSDSGPSTELEIVRLLNFSLKQTTIVLADLLTVGLVVRKGNVVVAQPKSRVFVARRIIAIEAKMRAWRNALEQAVVNLWFASHSYILVPALKCLHAIKLEAKKLGVGVLVFDGRRTRTVVRARKQPLPVSYGSWLINEWALRRLT